MALQQYQRLDVRLGELGVIWKFCGRCAASFCRTRSSPWRIASVAYSLADATISSKPRSLVFAVTDDAKSSIVVYWM